MPALIAILLVLTPFAVYLAWRRFGPGGGAPSTGALVGILLGVGVVLGGTMWLTLSRSLDRSEAYVPARLGADGRVVPQPPGQAR